MSECFDKNKIEEEELKEALATQDARAVVLQILEEKGYTPEDIETDREFTVRAGEREERVSVDYLITLRGKRYMAVKCSMAVVSRERHVLSFSRVVENYQIPLSVITDGVDALVMDTVTGKTIGESFDDIPSKEDALRTFDSLEFREYPPERLEKQTRILLAFECATCPTPKETE
jgi:hypothetical protein